MKEQNKEEWTPEVQKAFEEVQLKEQQDFDKYEKLYPKKFVYNDKEWINYSNAIGDEYCELKDNEKIICQIFTPDPRDPADNFYTLYARKTPSTELEKIFDGYNTETSALDEGNEYANKYIERKKKLNMTRKHLKNLSPSKNKNHGSHNRTR